MRALLLVCVAGLAHAGEFDARHPLSIATRQAVKLCVAIDAPSLDDCSNFVGNDPARKSARASVRVVLAERLKAMAACQDDIHRCTLRVDGLMQIGINAAWEQ